MLALQGICSLIMSTAIVNILAAFLWSDLVMPTIFTFRTTHLLPGEDKENWVLTKQKYKAAWTSAILQRHIFKFKLRGWLLLYSLEGTKYRIKQMLQGATTVLTDTGVTSSENGHNVSASWRHLGLQSNVRKLMEYDTVSKKMYQTFLLRKTLLRSENKMRGHSGVDVFHR